MRGVLSGVAKKGMGCFVPGCFVLHSHLYQYIHLLIKRGACCEKTLTYMHANVKGADQAVHLCSLIHAVVIRSIQSI